LWTVWTTPTHRFLTRPGRLAIISFGFFASRGRGGEAHLSAKPAAAQARPRVPGAHEDSGRSEGAARAEAARAKAPVGLTLAGWQRLKSRRAFQVVYGQGRSFANWGAVLYVLGPREGATRVGVAAGRRLGGAVVRNRLRRLLREAVRRLGGDLPAGYDLVLVARRGLLGKGQREADRAVRELLAQAGLAGRGEGP
jgi:ribonuclease P protein component